MSKIKNDLNDEHSSLSIGKNKININLNNFYNNNENENNKIKDRYLDEIENDDEDEYKDTLTKNSKLANKKSVRF